MKLSQFDNGLACRCVPLGAEPQHIHRDRRPCNGGDIGVIIRRRDLDHVGAADIELAAGAAGPRGSWRSTARPLPACRCLAHRPDRGSRYRRSDRPQRPCVVRDDRRGDLSGAHLLDLMAVEDANAEILRRVGADADLDGAVRIDDAVASRARDERSRDRSAGYRRARCPDARRTAPAPAARAWRHGPSRIGQVT